MGSKETRKSAIRDVQTLRFYAQEAPVYVTHGKNGASPHLAGFLKLLPSGAKILELGCGGGRDAEAMIAAGFNVEPTDGTPEIAAEAEERLKRPVRIMRFDELNADKCYDAVWANASLLHVPRDALPEILGRVRRALKPGGLHFASYKSGGREGRDGLGRYYNYLSRAELIRVYEHSGSWETVSIHEHSGGGYEPGVQVQWLTLTVRRTA